MRFVELSSIKVAESAGDVKIPSPLACRSLNWQEPEFQCPHWAEKRKENFGLHEACLPAFRRDLASGSLWRRHGQHATPIFAAKPTVLALTMTANAAAKPRQGSWSAARYLYRYLPTKSLAVWTRTSRLTSEMALVSGMLLGQTSTQFCAKPHSWMPPSPARARKRSAASTFPVG